MINIKGNPWLGLNTYTESDKLYGRNSEIVEVTDIILNNVQTIIYGRSGIGKSSLLQAGVFPRLRYEDFFPVYIRLEHNVGDTYIVQIFSRLKDEAEKNDIEIIGDNKLTDLYGILCDIKLRNRKSGFVKFPVYVFDQFEEIFTLTDINHKLQVDKFFSQLASVLNDNLNSSFRIVICLREDYLYFLEQKSVEIPSLKRNRYCLKSLNWEQGREVICFPCTSSVSEETANLILDKIDSDHTNNIAPAILSLFMHELYEKGNGMITKENIQLFGENIIADFYEEGIVSISFASREFLENRLVTSDGYRHSLSLSDALANGVKLEELDNLKTRRIVTIEKVDHNQRFIELSHDVLCPIILKSRDERKHKKEAEQLRAKAKVMKKRQHVILTFLMLALILVGVFAYMFLEIKKQQKGMLINQSRFIAKEAMELAKTEDYKAMALVAEVFPKNVKYPERPLVWEAYEVLRELNDKTIPLETFLVGQKHRINLAVYSPDGHRIVISSSDRTARIWNVDTGECLSVLEGHANDVNSAVFSPDGHRIVTASDDATARIWNVDSEKCVSVLDGHTATVNSATFSPDGHRIVTASMDKTARIWDANTGECTRVFEGHTNDVNSAVFSLDGHRIVTASDDNTVRIWDADLGKCLNVFKGHTAAVKSVAFSPDSHRIVTASYDNAVRIWNVDTGECLSVFEGHRAAVISAAFSPDGHRIVTASYDKTVRIWNVDTGECLSVFEGHTNDVNSAAFSPDGHRIVTASDDATARVWNANYRKCISVLKGHAAAVNSAAFSPDGHKIVTSSSDNTARIWATETSECIGILKGHTNDVNSAAFSPDGHRIVTSSSDNTARIWVTETGECIGILKGHTSKVNSAVFSPDGHRIVTASWNNIVRIWDVETGECIRILKGHTNIVTSAVFSPDGHRIVTSSNDNTARIWNVETGECIDILKRHTFGVNCAAFSPDGHKIVTASSDKTACIWDAETGKCISILKGHIHIVYSAAFSPDGHKIVTTSSDKTVRFWNIPDPQELIDNTLKKLKGYKLSKEDKQRYYLE